MKNLTLRVDEKVLKKARRRAQEESTSVNALVREYLETFASADDKVAKARREILRLSRASTAKVGKTKISRDHIYDR